MGNAGASWSLGVILQILLKWSSPMPGFGEAAWVMSKIKLKWGAGQITNPANPNRFLETLFTDTDTLQVDLVSNQLFNDHMSPWQTPPLITKNWQIVEASQGQPPPLHNKAGDLKGSGISPATSTWLAWEFAEVPCFVAFYGLQIVKVERKRVTFE